MRTLTPAARRAFRAKAHPLHPFVTIGHHGLTAAVLHEIDVSLLAHELIKIRVGSDDRSEREALLARICTELDAAPVQHLGKILTVWRPAPPPEPAPVAPRSERRPRSQAPKAGAKTAVKPPTVRRAAAATAKRAPRRGPSVILGGEPAGRRPRDGATGSGSKPASRRPSGPHGKSASSSVGASGARRRRKAR
jgi:putative YhbY family RNA-binding protein